MWVVSRLPLGKSAKMPLQELALITKQQMNSRALCTTVYAEPKDHKVASERLTHYSSSQTRQENASTGGALQPQPHAFASRCERFCESSVKDIGRTCEKYNVQGGMQPVVSVRVDGNEHERSRYCRKNHRP